MRRAFLVLASIAALVLSVAHYSFDNRVTSGNIQENRHRVIHPCDGADYVPGKGETGPLLRNLGSKGSNPAYHRSFFRITEDGRQVMAAPALVSPAPLAPTSIGWIILSASRKP